MKICSALILTLLFPLCARAGTVTLIWDANPVSDNVAYYTLSYYEDEQKVLRQAAVIVPTVTISLPNNNLWYASVTATDKSGHTSQPSRQVIISPREKALGGKS